MKTIIIAIALTLISSFALAVPSPVVDMPLVEWNFGNEPALRGGAKYIEQFTVRNGTPSKSKYFISLDSEGNYLESKLVTEGSDKSYITAYRRDDSRNLVSITQTIVKGEVIEVNSRETATYENSNLLSIVAERQLTKAELQPEGKVMVATASDGGKTITLSSPEGKTQMVITLSFDDDNRFSKVIISRGERLYERAVERNASGLITQLTNNSSVVSAVYDIDDKGNWTRAVITNVAKTADGKSKKRVKEVVRKIAY